MCLLLCCVLGSICGQSRVFETSHTSYSEQEKKDEGKGRKGNDGVRQGRIIMKRDKEGGSEKNRRKSKNMKKEENKRKLRENQRIKRARN
jgi:hypothetical protein